MHHHHHPKRKSLPGPRVHSLTRRYDTRSLKHKVAGLCGAAGITQKKAMLFTPSMACRQGIVAGFSRPPGTASHQTSPHCQVRVDGQRANFHITWADKGRHNQDVDAYRLCEGCLLIFTNTFWNERVSQKWPLPPKGVPSSAKETWKVSGWFDLQLSKSSQQFQHTCCCLHLDCMRICIPSC